MPRLKNNVRPLIRTATAAPPGSFGQVASSRATIFSTLLSGPGEPACAEPVIRAVINATHASLIVFMCRRLLRRRRIVRRLFAIWIGIAAGGRPGRRSTPLLGCPSSIRCSPPKRKPTLHNLGAWYDKYGSSTFAKTWQEERQQGDKEAL